jgi:hypothetical protein
MLRLTKKCGTFVVYIADSGHPSASVTKHHFVVSSFSSLIYPSSFLSSPMVLTCSDHILFFSPPTPSVCLLFQVHIMFLSFQFFRSITSDSAVLRDDYDVRDGNIADDFTLHRTFQGLKKE